MCQESQAIPEFKETIKEKLYANLVDPKYKQEDIGDFIESIDQVQETIKKRKRELETANQEEAVFKLKYSHGKLTVMENEPGTNTQTAFDYNH